MEEVWKDINLSSLHDHHSRSDREFSINTPINLQHHHPHPHPHPHLHPHSNLRNIILQDFLSTSSTSSSSSKSSSSAAASQQPPPIALSLNSTRELHFLDNNAHFRPNLHSQCQPTFQSSFDQVLGPPIPNFGKKRIQDSDSPDNNNINNNNNPGDRRHKRMIKNRESAARSRARKQAYTNELELEVAHLMEENAKLRRQQDQLRNTAASQVPKNHRLHRASTAPF